MVCLLFTIFYKGDSKRESAEDFERDQGRIVDMYVTRLMSSSVVKETINRAFSHLDLLDENWIAVAKTTVCSWKQISLLMVVVQKRECIYF